MNRRGSVVNHPLVVETALAPLTRDKVGGEPVDRPTGDRHEGGVTLIQALIRNLGTCRADAKGDFQVDELHKKQSTDAAHRGGSARSRDECAEMALDRRGAVVWPCRTGNSQEEDWRG